MRKTVVIDEVDGSEHRCLNESAECAGDVEWRYVGERVWPRCLFHDRKRQQVRSRSIERFADSVFAPSWFDPTLAGESW